MALSPALQSQIQSALLGAKRAKPVRFTFGEFVEGDNVEATPLEVEIHKPTRGQRKDVQKQVVSYAPDGSFQIDTKLQMLLWVKMLVFYPGTDTPVFEDAHNDTILGADDDSALGRLIDKVEEIARPKSQAEAEAVRGN